MEVTLELGAELLVLTKCVVTMAAARKRLEGLIASGAALEKFREMVAAQGGNLDAPRPVAPAHEVASPRAGYVTAIDTEDIGIVIIELGGRAEEARRQARLVRWHRNAGPTWRSG